MNNLTIQYSESFKNEIEELRGAHKKKKKKNPKQKHITRAW